MLQSIMYVKRRSVTAVLCALFLIALGAITVFEQTTFRLLQPTELLLGQATALGYDIGARIRFYYLLIGLTPLVGWIGYRLFVWIFSKTNFTLSQYHSVQTLCVFGFVLSFSHLLGIRSYLALRIISLCLLYVLFAYSMANAVQRCKKLAKPDTLFQLVCLAILVCFWVGLLGIPLSIWFLPVFVTALGLSTFFLVALPLDSSNYFRICLPLCSTPFALLLAVEYWFYSEAHRLMPISILGLTASLVALAFLLAFVLRIPFSQRRMLWMYAFSCLIGALWLRFYQPVMAQSTDFFEYANPANAQLRMFRFHEWPGIDFMSSHMFSEQFYGIIFHALFGYTGGRPDFLVYECLYTVLFYVLIFWALVRWFKSPASVFFFILVFPYAENLFSLHLFFSVVLLFQVHKVVQQQQYKTIVGAALLGLLLVFWRLDTGVAACMSALVFLVMGLFIERKKIVYKAWIQSFAILFLLLITAGIVLLYFRPANDLITHVQLAMQYLSANQAHGYALLANAFDQHVFLFYAGIPIFSLAAIIALVGYMYQYRRTDILLYAAVFFHLMVLFNFQRGLVRHNFMEGNDSFLAATFYLALALSVTGFIPKRLSSYRFIIFTLTGFGAVVCISYFPLSQSPSFIDSLLTKTTLLHPETEWCTRDRVGRTQIDNTFADKEYRSFDCFLKTHLRAQQTFFDFSNSPMLYYYTQRRIPSYFCQNTQNAVSLSIQQYDIRNWDTAAIPVVVYSHAPPNWFDACDAVPNALRQYAYAEFIYTHYKPLGIINQRSIWIAKPLNYLPVGENDTLSMREATHDYQYAALYIAQYYRKHTQALGRRMAALSCVNRAITDLPNSIAAKPGIWLQVYLSHPASGNVRLAIEKDSITECAYSFQTRASDSVYQVRLSNQYLWYTAGKKQLRLTGADADSIVYYCEPTK